MKILRKLYSSKKTEEKENKERDAALALSVGYLGSKRVGSIHGRLHRSLDNALNKELSSADKEERKRINNKLKEKARKEGFTVTEHKNFDNSAFVLSNPKGDLDKLEQKKENIKKSKNLSTKQKNSKIKRIEGAQKRIEEQYKGIDINKLSNNEKNIVMGRGNNSPAVFAHELGHARKFGSKKKIEKLGQKGGIAGKVGLMAAPIQALHTGIASGYYGERDGSKEDAISKNAHRVMSIGGSAGLIGAELGASRGAMKYLKQEKASKKLMRASRKELGLALGTYVAHGTANIIGSEMSHVAGKTVGKHLARREKRKEEK